MGFVGNIIESIMRAAVSESPESQEPGGMRLTKPTVLFRLLISSQMHANSIFCASLWFYLEHKEKIGWFFSGIIFFLLFQPYLLGGTAHSQRSRSPPPIETIEKKLVPKMKIPKYSRTRKYYNILLLQFFSRRREWLREYFGGTVPSASAAGQSLLQAKKKVQLTVYFTIFYHISI